MEREKIEKAVRKALEGREEILVAYLYGSMSRGQETRESDVDVGVLLKHTYKPPPMYEAKLSLKLEERLGKETEVRVLNQKNITFQHQVLKHSKPLLIRDDRERIIFETTTYSRYLDYKPYFIEYNTIRKKRMET